jgi:hypothetical protein
VWIFQKTNPIENNFNNQRKIKIKSSKIVLKCKETTKGKAKKKERKYVKKKRWMIMLPKEHL